MPDEYFPPFRVLVKALQLSKGVCLIDGSPASVYVYPSQRGEKLPQIVFRLLNAGLKTLKVTKEIPIRQDSLECIGMGDERGITIKAKGYPLFFLSFCLPYPLTFICEYLEAREHHATLCEKEYNANLKRVIDFAESRKIAVEEAAAILYPDGLISPQLAVPENPKRPSIPAAYSLNLLDHRERLTYGKN